MGGRHQHDLTALVLHPGGAIVRLASLFAEIKRCSRAEWIVAAALVCSAPTMMHMLSPRVLHAQSNSASNSFYFTDPNTIPAATPGTTITVSGYFQNGPVPLCFYTGFGSTAALTPSIDSDSFTEIITVPASTIQQIPASRFSRGTFNAVIYAPSSARVACNGSYSGSFSTSINVTIALPTLDHASVSALPQPNPNLGPVTRPSLIDLAGSNFSSTAVVKYTGYAAPTSTFINSGSIRSNFPATGATTTLTAIVCNEGPVEYCSSGLDIPIAPLDTLTGSLAASPSPTTPSTATSLTATFSAGFSGVPYGTVTFKDGSSTIGTAPLTLTSGRFGASTSTDLSATAENNHAIVADFNNDGIPDVLLYTAHTFDVFLASSIRGTFAPDAQNYLDSSYCGTLLGVTAGDFTEDGYTDLALLCTRQGSDTVKYVVIYHNNGDGTFTQDVNPALLPRVVPVHPNAAGAPPPVSVQPNITFQANTSATLITSADINKDGHIDIILAGPDDNGDVAIQTYPGLGTGSFDTTKPEILAPAAYGSQIAAVDLNNDGYPDLVLLNDDGNPDSNDIKNLVVFQNDGKGSFPATPTYQRAPGDSYSNSQFFIQKLPTSVYPNIVVVNTGPTQQITTLLNNRTSTIGFNNTAYVTTATGLLSASMGDFDGDGYPDLAVYSTPDGGSTYKLDVYSSDHLIGQYNTPTASFSSNATGAINRLLDATSDVNGDGYADPLLIIPSPSYYGSLDQFLTNGTATATLAGANFASGLHSLSAVYPGTNTYAPITPTTTLQSNGPTDFLSLAATPQPVTYGAPVTYTLNAHIDTNASSPLATGTVTFQNATNTTLLGTVTLTQLSAGVPTSSASVNFGPLNAGTYSLTARYNGDSNYPAANFKPVSFTIAKATPTVAYNPTPTTITSGTRLVASQLTSAARAIFNSTTVPGTFAFTNASGQTVDTSTVLPVGNNVITATFTPTDTTNYNTASKTATITVLAIPTLTLGVTPTSPTTYSATGKETLTATVSSGTAPTPTGSVQFFDGGTSLGNVTLTTGTGSSSATLLAGPLAPGPHSLSFTYSGDSAYANGTSTATSYVVNQTTPTVNYTLAQPTITYGTPVGGSNLVATATSGANSVPGTFVFTDAANNPVTASTLFPAGPRTITATFTPADNVTYSTASKTVTLTVNKATPVITFVPNPNTIPYPTPLSAAQLDATVSGNLPGSFSYFASGTSAATVVNVGTVLGVGTYNLTANFTPTDTANYNSAAPLTTNFTVTKATPTVTYNPSPATIPPGTPLVASQLNASAVYNSASVPGTFAYTTASNQPVVLGTVLPPGANAITATFTPTDAANYSTAASTATITVLRTPVVTLSVSPSSPTTYTQETITASVAGGSAPIPTGVVEFYDGAQLLGSVNVTGPQTTATGLLRVILLAGVHSLTVKYDGDATYAATTSAPVSYTVTKITPVITYNPTPTTFTYGSALVASQLNATATDNGTPVTGTIAYTYNGVAVGVGSILPAGNGLMTATFTPTGTQNNTNTYSTATGTASFTVAKAVATLAYTPTPAIIPSATGLVAAQLNATATFAGKTLPGTFAYTNAASQAVVAGTALPVGSNVITATFTPTDTANYAINATTGTIQVTGTVSVNLNVTPASPATYSSTGTETLSVTVSSSTTPVPTGTVQFFDGTTSLGTKTLTVSSSNATASLTVGPLTPGTHSLTAVYSGDTNYVTATSAPSSYVVNQTTPTITYAPLPATISYGTALVAGQLNATATSSSGTVPGTFVYTLAGVPVTTSTVLPAGSNLILATFTSTDNVTYTSATKTATVLVNKASPALTYAPAPATITYGTALVAGQLNATSTVPGTFAYTLGTAPVNTTTVLPAGANIITATFTPTDTNSYAVTTKTATINVTAATPTLTYNPNPTSIVLGTPVIGSQLNATALFNSTTVPGTFAYTANGNPVVVGTLLPVGGNVITATFTPTDTATYSITTKTATINVAQAAPSVVLVVNPTSPTTYTATGTETLNVTISSSTAPTPTGTVQFLDGTTLLGTRPLTGSSGSAIASLTAGPLTPGTHVLTAVYSGDNSYTTLTSAPNSYVVNQAVPALTYAPAPATITYGTGLVSGQLNALATFNSTTVPGTYTYRAGTTPLAVGSILPFGSNTITATFTPTDATTYTTATRTAVINVTQATPVITYLPAPASVIYGTGVVLGQLNATATVGGNTVPGTFQYIFRVQPVTVGTILPVGTNTIFATFTPTDPTSFASGSTPGTITVTQGTANVNLSIAPATPTTYSASGTETLTADVTSAGTPTPTGSIQFFDGTSLLGTKTLTVSGATSTASITVGPLAAGTHILTATYSGDTTYTALTSPPSTFTVNKATPTLTYAPTPAAITFGTGLVASQLNATSSIPGAVVYTLGTTPLAVGNPLPAGANTITATFTPTDAVNYTTATRSAVITVGQATPAIIFNPAPATITYGTALIAAQLNAAATFAGNTVPGTFAFTSAGKPVAVGTILPAGANLITATFTPTDTLSYAVTTTTSTINVGAATPALTYTPAPAAITYGTALIANQLNATAAFAGSTVPGAFAYTSVGKPVLVGTILPAGANLITATFTPTDTLSYAVTTTTSTINVGAATPALTYTPAPAAITYGTAVTASQLNATATFAGSTVPGTFAYTSAGKPVIVGTILPAGTNIITATFSPTDAADFLLTTTTSTINVGAATPVLTYTPAPTTITYGTALVAGQLNAGAAFAGNNIPGTVTYTVAGNAVAAGSILPAGANVIRATFTPTDAITYTAATTTATINVGTAAPTIVWTTPAPITAGTPLSGTQLNATATGIGGINLPGTFTYTPAVGTILPVGPATLSVTFVPADAANYSSITSTVPLSVQPALTTTTLNSSPNPSQFGQPVTFSVSVSSPYVQVPLTGVVNVFDGTTLIGSTTLPNPSVTTAALSAGPHTITAVYAGTSNFTTSTSASITQTVASATTTLTWPTPASIPYGTRLSAAQLNAAVATAFATTVPGTFVYTPAAGTLLNAGTQTLSVVFTPTDTVNFKTATASVNLIVTKVNPTLTWASPSTFPAGTPLGATQLNATATDIAGAALPGIFTYTPAAGTVLAPGATTLNATFVPTDTVDYNNASISVPLTVDLAAPTITVSSSANPAQFGQPVTFSVGVTTIYTASPLTGTLKVFDGTTLIGSPTLTAGQATLPISTLTAGPHSITAVYSGNTNFATATSAALTETINAATTTIAWATPADIPYGTKLSATQLNATVSTAYATTILGTFVYTPAAGTLLPAGSQTLSVTFTPTDTTSFKPVTSTVTINVGKIAPVITWTAPADVIAGTTLSATQLNATAAGIAGALPGTFAYTPPAGTVLAPGTQTLSTTFTPADLANYTTATATVPLNVIGLSLTSLSSTTANLGQPATTITLTGTGFATDAVVKVDGAAVATTYVSRTSLTAIIPASVFLATHTIQVQVVDPTLAQTSNTLSILMSTPPISVVFQGPTTVAPGQQPTLTFGLTGTYPVPVTGTFTITFTPASGLPAGTDDPTIVFPNGKRTFSFTIPANSSVTPPVVLQTGSVAGTITVSLTLVVNGQTITPTPAVAPVVIASPAAVPGVTSVVLTRSGNTLTVALFGYSNIRQVDHVTFHFLPSAGQQLNTTDITIDGATLFAPYFASPASVPVGGSFEYDQVFNLDQNAIVVGEVQVKLYNSIGESLPGTAQ